MPPALRVAPGGGVGIAACGETAGACAAGDVTLAIGAAAVAAAGMDGTGAVAIDSDSAGATPLPVMDCVVTGPKTGAEGCAVAGVCVTGC